MMKKIRREDKGITLIALVVTIIILLILAGVAITLIVGNNGLFARAQNAANTWKKAEANEKEEIGKFERLYDETVKNLGLGNVSENGGATKPVGEITGEETRNTQVVDKNGDKAFVPAGFIVDENANIVEEGLVVIDKKGGNADTVGNEFVWVPCTLDGANESLKYNRYVFTRENPTWNYRQSLILGTDGEYEKDADGSYKIQRVDNISYYFHEAMSEKERASIERYGGYYIGRYEAGVDSERSEVSNINDVARIKASLPVYNNVTRDEAITIAERMYVGKSKLCSSYAWDTALKFIGGTYAVNSEGENYSEKLKNTGYHAEKNIFDMGGNAREWTTETFTASSDSGVYRRWSLQH